MSSFCQHNRRFINKSMENVNIDAKVQWEKGLCDDEVMEIYLSFWFFFSVFVLDFRLGIPGGRK